MDEVTGQAYADRAMTEGYSATADPPAILRPRTTDDDPPSTVEETFRAAGRDIRKSVPQRRADILMAALPEFLRIGPHDYRIVRLTPHEAYSRGCAFGEIDHPKQEIRLNDHLNPVNLVDTLLHEAIHGMWRNALLGDSGEKERAITVLGTGLTALFRDNPWLAGWINGAMK